MVLLDGVEDGEGRALFLISALYHCSVDLLNCTIRVLDASQPAVIAAIALLRWDTGLDVAPVSERDVVQNTSIFRGARLYAAVRFRATTGLHLAEARFFDVPLLVALQFPDEAAIDPDRLRLLQAAHDPAILARHIVRAVR